VAVDVERFALPDTQPQTVTGFTAAGFVPLGGQFPYQSGFSQYKWGVTSFRGGLVFKAHRLLYHSTLGLRVMKKKTSASTKTEAAWPSTWSACPIDPTCARNSS